MVRPDTASRHETRGFSPRMIATAIIAIAAANSSASAQCLQPDNLIGGCCQFVIPTLPPFPGVSMPGASICYNNCTVGGMTNTKVVWSQPVAVTCTQFVANLQVFDQNSGLPIIAGPLVLDYTRTWDEQSPSGSIHQVWRFTAKADLSFVPVGVAWSCESPNCIAPFGPHPHAFYYGYVDYVADCSNPGVFENAIVMQHACDTFIHRPGFSSVPGAFHPNRSYAIVAPHSTAQPFLPGNLAAPASPFLFGEATRDVSLNFTPFCLDEDPLQSAVMNQLGGVCMATLSVGPKQHWLRRHSGVGACPDPVGLNGGFQSLAIGFPNTLPWFHLMSTSIGTWTNNNVYPGAERAWTDEGLFIHNQVCVGQYVEVKYGATTKGGWFVLHPVLLDNFTDLADNWSAPLTGPYPFPIFGHIMATEHLTYVMGP
jgi:hypothetical protein